MIMKILYNKKANKNKFIYTVYFKINDKWEWAFDANSYALIGDLVSEYKGRLMESEE